MPTSYHFTDKFTRRHNAGKHLKLSHNLDLPGEISE